MCIPFGVQGPVVHSIVSRTKSLVKDLLTLIVLAKSTAVIIFAEKLWKTFALQKSCTFFSAKNDRVFAYNTFEILMSCSPTTLLVLNKWVQGIFFQTVSRKIPAGLVQVLMWNV